jgi:hypothetical protein
LVPGGFQMTLSWLMRAPGQLRKVAQARATSRRRTIPAITRSDLQPLQIWRVSSGESRPSRQFHSSGASPVSNSPRNSFSKALPRRVDGVRVEHLVENDEAVLLKALDLPFAQFDHAALTRPRRRSGPGGQFRDAP